MSIKFDETYQHFLNLHSMFNHYTESDARKIPLFFQEHSDLEEALKRIDSLQRSDDSFVWQPPTKKKQKIIILKLKKKTMKLNILC